LRLLPRRRKLEKKRLSPVLFLQSTIVKSNQPAHFAARPISLEKIARMF